MSVIDLLHEEYILGRRARLLAARLGARLPREAAVLDVGCGDGAVAKHLLSSRPDLDYRAVEVVVRPDCLVPALPFDGRTLPVPDASVDVVMFVDVLHHADDAVALLAEGARVARRAVVVKDHDSGRPFAEPTLRFMDRVGNARHGVALPYSYWPRRRWNEVFASLGLRVEHWEQGLGLYPPPASWLFGGSLQFLATLRRA
ncbi:MAG: methyltransferase domain-containing protein [Gemmatimonadaceae bacterium]